MLARNALLILLTLSLASLPSATAAGAGPAFADTVAQDETNHHTFTNAPKGSQCIQITASYTIQLTHAPTDAVLTLEAGGSSTNVTGGTGSLTITKGWCTSFTISVTGTSVEDQAAYALTVTRLAQGGVATS